MFRHTVVSGQQQHCVQSCESSVSNYDGEQQHGVKRVRALTHTHSDGPQRYTQIRFNWKMSALITLCSLSSSLPLLLLLHLLSLTPSMFGLTLTHTLSYSVWVTNFPSIHLCLSLPSSSSPRHTHLIQNILLPSYWELILRELKKQKMLVLLDV